MKVITDVIADKAAIEKSIQKHGYFSEHNYHHYAYSAEANMQNVFFLFQNHMGIMAQREKNDIWHLFSGVLAPAEKRLDLFTTFLDHIFTEEKAKKVVVEVDGEFRQELLRTLKRSGYKDLTLYYVLHWPILDLTSWDPKLNGKEWKKMRNIRNRLYKNHSVRITDSRKVNKEKLKKVVVRWEKWRNSDEKATSESYLSLIDNNFEGCHVARTIYIDGEPCTINAGWKVPNSAHYYSAIGVLNYRHEGVGEIAMLDELEQLKRRGFRYVDLGGSDIDLLKFKKKFKPSHTYKTYIFSIVKK